MTRAIRVTLRKEQGPATALQVRKRAKLTYYRAGDRSVLSAIETEAEVSGDLTIYFAGLTGGYSATGS